MNSKFHERFNIDVDMEEAKRRFVNRAYNLIFNSFLPQGLADPSIARRKVITALGEIYRRGDVLENHIGNDFYKCLQALEAL